MTVHADVVEEDRETQQRIALLAELGILDTDPEPGFDALTDAAATSTDCPIALFSLIDGDRQWFKSRRGVDETETPRRWSFCAHAVRYPGLMEVFDARADPRFQANPFVLGSPRIRFYAGQPISLSDVRIGTLCVIDTRPRHLSAKEKEALASLGVAATALLGERRSRLSSLEQQRRLTDFAMLAGDWLWETDHEHRVTWMSCAYATLSASPEPWALGRKMADSAVLDTSAQAVLPPMTLHEVLQRKRSFAHAVVRGHTPSGPSYLSLSAVCRRDAAGKWCGYRGIARDMTARVDAERARRDVADVLAEVSSQLPGLIFQFRLQPDGRMSFPYISDRIREVYELTAAEVRSDATPLFARCHPEDIDRLMASIHESAHELAPWSLSFRVRLPACGLRTLSGQAKPKRLDDGSVLWHGMIADVTEQTLEAERQQAASRAQAATEKAGQVRSEMLSRVSHELRTPLNAILGFAQLLRINASLDNGEETLRSAMQIERAGTHLLSLVNDMLDLSSLDAGRLALTLQPVSVAAVVAWCLSLVEPHAQQEGVTLSAAIEPGLPAVCADTRAVKQVLFNLVGNAIKFGRAGMRVEIRAALAMQGDEVALSIIDHGPGIAADKMSSLFEPFTRIHTGSGAPIGSGLGLSISRKLVLAMNGRLEVTSEPGNGTTFSIYLPADGRPDIHDSDSDFGPLATVDELPPVSETTVLYIEDDPVNGILMEQLFKSLPSALRLVVAATGRDGIHDATLMRPQLILLDMNLPDLDGLTVLSQLQSDWRTAKIPVIALSADAMPEQVSLALKSGVVDYWTKPIDLEHVRSELLRRCARGDDPAPAAAAP